MRWELRCGDAPLRVGLRLPSLIDPFGSRSRWRASTIPKESERVAGGESVANTTGTDRVIKRCPRRGGTLRSDLCAGPGPILPIEPAPVGRSAANNLA